VCNQRSAGVWCNQSREMHDGKLSFLRSDQSEMESPLVTLRGTLAGDRYNHTQLA